jgi:membrane protein involved in colicin uptake
MAWTVALSFTERAFFVSSTFTGETLYAVPGVNFIDITVSVENLIEMLYQMYEQEEQDKKMLDQQDPQESQDMFCQHEELGQVLEEEKMKKMEDMRRRKEEKLQRKEKNRGGSSD